MILAKDLVNALRSSLKEISSLIQIYEDLHPKMKMKRPSALIQHVTEEIRDGNKDLVQVAQYFTVTVFGSVDAYSQSETQELLELRDQIMLLFRKGYFHVPDSAFPQKDRALKVFASTGGKDWDRAYIDLTFEYFDNRTDQQETLPMMEEIDLVTELKTNQGE